MSPVDIGDCRESGTIIPALLPAAVVLSARYGARAAEVGSGDETHFSAEPEDDSEKSLLFTHSRLRIPA
jgi:hypothetical protein